MSGRLLSQNLWARYSQEATNVAVWMDFSEEQVAASQALHTRLPGPWPVRNLGWFIPDFHHPFYGGIHTILRFADHFQRHAGVRNHFFVTGTSPAPRIANLIAQAFPILAEAPVTRLPGYAEIRTLPATDASIATLWSTAYFLLKYNRTQRKFYFLQDYEPLFYPAGSMYAQVEATYHFGFYGLANTPSVKQIYEEQYGGRAEYFVPCVDTQIFRPAIPPRPAGPFTIFFYGRPEHPRNGFELGAAALRQVKQRLGSGVRIVAAGASWNPAELDLEGVVENLGLLSYTQTADLYRTCDAGLVLMFTRHPSYLPLELMASGCLVVTNRNPATQWLVRDRENCLLAKPSATCLAAALEWAASHPTERHAITATAARQIQTRYSDWGREINKMYRFMCDPLGDGPDASERNEPATDDQGEAAGRVRASQVDLVQRPGAGPPVSAEARPPVVQQQPPVFQQQPEADQGGFRIVVKRGEERCTLTPGLFDDFDFHSGDELSVVPIDQASKLIKTPEGNVHILTADGSGIRVPTKMEFTPYRGYLMPEHLVRLTGAGSETFDELGKGHVANYRKYVGLQPGMSFLEIGSGIGRDAFQLIEALGPTGKYIGIDVQRESIVWCQKNISRDHPNFQFYHFNAMHELHNPLGSKTTLDYRLPAAHRSIDRIGLQSLLTHIFEDEVVHYLSELARVLKPDGLAYVTFLLYSEEIVAASRINDLTPYGLRFEYPYADGCYVNNAQYPTGGVAYTDEAMQRMIKRSGLRLIRPYLKGYWSGYYADPDDGQDVAILGPALDAAHR